MAQQLLQLGPPSMCGPSLLPVYCWMAVLCVRVYTPPPCWRTAGLSAEDRGGFKTLHQLMYPVIEQMCEGAEDTMKAVSGAVLISAGRKPEGGEAAVVVLFAGSGRTESHRVGGEGHSHWHL